MGGVKAKVKGKTVNKLYCSRVFRNVLVYGPAIKDSLQTTK